MIHASSLDIQIARWRDEEMDQMEPNGMMAERTMPEADVPAVIELVGVSKQFGAVQALRAVDLALFPGEVHALVGENGAGKSTLVKMLAGVHRPDTGAMRLGGDFPPVGGRWREAPEGGEEVSCRSPLDAYHHGVAVIHQHPTLFPDLDVAENVYMGRQPRDRAGRVGWRQMYKDVDGLLRRLGVKINV